MLRREEMKQEHEGAEEAVVVEEVYPGEEAEVEEATRLLSRYMLVLYFETFLLESGKISF